MSVTLTIKQVPEALATALKERAAANKRSLQKELLVIMERAAEPGGSAAMPWPGIAEPVHARYTTRAPDPRGSKRAQAPASGKLTLDQLWQRARKLGAAMPDESVDIVRRDRDARQR